MRDLSPEYLVLGGAELYDTFLWLNLMFQIIKLWLDVIGINTGEVLQNAKAI